MTLWNSTWNRRFAERGEEMIFKRYVEKLPLFPAFVAVSAEPEKMTL